MAKREGGSSPVFWLILGILAGVLATVAIYLFLTRSPDEADPIEPAPSVQMETPALPAEPIAPPATPPVVAPEPTPTPPRPAPSEPDEQVNEDAAATGMTGPATPQDDTAVNPTN